MQALDLLGRKVLGSQGKLLQVFTREIHQLCKSQTDVPEMARFITPLSRVNKEWGELTTRIGMSALQSKEEAGAASVDYLMYSGYVVLAYFWAQAARVANSQLDQGVGDTQFLSAKLFTARFYFERLLPRTQSLAVTMTSGADNLMDLDVDHLAF